MTLGQTTPLTAAILGTGDVHLEISVDGETLEPRRALLAVPFAVRAAEADSLGGVTGGFYTGIIEHFAFDGADPPNDDPSEGTADADGDGTPNFLDVDNDDDGLSDLSELAQGSDINLVTPIVGDTSPDPVELNVPTLVTVDGSNFEAGIAVDLEGVPVTAGNVTATSFEADLTPLLEGANQLTVVRTNGESDATTVTAVRIVPTITGVFPATLEVGEPTAISVEGTNFGPGISVDLEGAPSTPTNVTDTSFDVVVTAAMEGTNVLTVTRVSGESASFNLAAGEEFRLVFVATTSNGNLGGLAGADAACAAQAGGAPPGTYLAWLSDATTDPASRFNQSGGPFIREDGASVADDWADLTDGTLDSPIDPDSVVSVWSNTATDGTRLAAKPDCQGWTTSSNTEGGGRAFPTSTTSTWTDGSPVANCESLLGFYCFEQ